MITTFYGKTSKGEEKNYMVQRWKPSRYNKFFDTDDGVHLAYNSMSGGFAILDEDSYHQVIKILAEPSAYLFDSPEKLQLKKKLIQAKFLIKEDEDELQILKMFYRLRRYNTDSFGLTIAPTLDCNFRCVYCYEQHKKEYMSEEIEEEIVKLVNQRARYISDFGVTWFGGEPLLKLDTIERLTYQFKKICDSKTIKYRSSIITNGYALSKKVATKLVSLGIAAVQITLDGPPDVHNRRRRLYNGGATYSVILNNLCEIVSIFNRITLRVNVDRTNKDRVVELLDILELNGLKNKVVISFGRVNPYTQACADIAGVCLNREEHSKLFTELFSYSVKHRFIIPSGPTPLHSTVCTAANSHSFVIDATGRLYKCWDDVGNYSAVIGRLKDNIIYTHRLTKWLTVDVFDREECCTCDVLPLCMGGCPAGMVHPHPAGNFDSCEIWKYNLLDVLKIKYSYHNMCSVK